MTIECWSDSGNPALAGTTECWSDSGNPALEGTIEAALNQHYYSKDLVILTSYNLPSDENQIFYNHSSGNYNSEVFT